MYLRDALRVSEESIRSGTGRAAVSRRLIRRFDSGSTGIVGASTRRRRCSGRLNRSRLSCRPDAGPSSTRKSPPSILGTHYDAVRVILSDRVATICGMLLEGQLLES